MSDLEFYNKQDKEELVSMCIARDNKINSLKQEVNFYKDLSNTANNELNLLQDKYATLLAIKESKKEKIILNKLEQWLYKYISINIRAIECPLSSQSEIEEMKVENRLIFDILERINELRRHTK